VDVRASRVCVWGGVSVWVMGTGCAGE